MRNSNSNILIFLIILNISCKKLGNGDVHGTVSESGSDVPIEGATVILQSWQSNCSECEYHYDSVYTDSEGKFKLNFKKQINHQYHLFFRHNDYFGYSYWVTEKKNDYQVTLDPNAYIRFRIKKLTESNHILSVNVYDYNMNYSFKGVIIDTLLPELIRIRGNCPTALNWSVKSAYPEVPQEVSFHADVTIGKNQILIYTIEYE